MQTNKSMQDQNADTTAADIILEQTDLYRVDAMRRLDPDQRAQLGQYFTPLAVARFMASLFSNPPSEVRLLDAGAGVGSLTAAFVDGIREYETDVSTLAISAYEIDSVLAEYIDLTLTQCEEVCQNQGIELKAEIEVKDFIRAGVDMLRGGLFPVESKSFNRAIMNPPYKKIGTSSEHRQLLREIGMETSNLYSGFLAVAIQLLEPGGELVAITPRSFCNGPYFKPFREMFLETMALRRIHIFEARDEAFQVDDVLQETIIFHAIKGAQRSKVTISANRGPGDRPMTIRGVDYNRVVKPSNPESFIYIATSDMDQLVVDRMTVFNHTLDDLDLSVSTGRVVAFRAKESIRDEPSEDTVPLIYPSHFDKGYVQWPKKGRKPNAIALNLNTERLMLPSGNYVLVKRFSSKEEPKRVVAALYDPKQVPSSQVGFENHLNVYHRDNAGLPTHLAKGLAVFLNSTLVDSYFRQFNGHTQVNATDLRILPYPSLETLKALGSTVQEELPSQQEIDELLEKEINQMSDIESTDPISAKQKIDQAIEILKALGLPRMQQNERSALTFLALLNLKPEIPWAEAEAPLMGITPIMDFCRDHYGKEYAPNTRETFRRQSMHQFVDAGLAVPNPDRPDRPTNSPKYCYQIEPSVLELLKSFGTDEWDTNLEEYLGSVETLKERYARKREMSMVPVQMADGQEIKLTPGEHSELIKAIIERFGMVHEGTMRTLTI
jgi:adenine-specific DNA-methyltransferase